MSTADLRTLIPDKPHYDRVAATGDGAAAEFTLTNIPALGTTAKVYLDGVLQSSGYTLDADLGLLTFTPPPGVGVAVVVTYQYAMFADADLDAFLTMEGQDVRRAAALALDTIASQQALLLKVVKLLDMSVDGAKLAAELRARAKGLREQADLYAVPDFAEWVVSDFAARERLRDQALRRAI